MARTPVNRTPLTRTQLGRSLPLRAVVPGRRPAAVAAAADDPAQAPTSLDAVVDWARYAGGVRQPPQEFEEACRAARDSGGFVWIRLDEPTAAEASVLCPDLVRHPA